MKYILLVLSFSLFGFTNPKKISVKKSLGKPNIIFIMADDLGRGLLSHYGQQIIKTPTIDRLASEGVSFENVYASAYCAPSRARFITGYSDCRPGKYVLTSAGIYTKVAEGKMTNEEAQNRVNEVIGNEPDITYLPQVFKQAGYVTGQVGKLDYGFTTTTKQMNNHGWDYYFGYYDHQQCHGFYPKILYENGKMINIPGNSKADAGKNGEWGDEESNNQRWNLVGKTVYSQDLFLQKTLEFIRTNKNKPFFLYHATQLPHGPVSIPSVHPDYVFDTRLTQIEKEYASMVKRLDDDVAIMMQELKRLGIADNTIVIFSSDNGHEIYYSNKGRIEKPYKNMKTGLLFDDFTNVYSSALSGDVFDGNDGMSGLKRSNLEGGVRVPLFIYWPEKFRKGWVDKSLVTNYDFLTTVADMLGVKTKDTKDGISYLPVLTGKGNFKQHKAVACATHEGPLLVTSDGWKLRYFAARKVYQLFYLPNDYREENNLAEKEPQKLNELKKAL